MSRVTHFEIHAEDPERAIVFYEKVLGWTFNLWPGPQEYWMIKTGPDDEPGIDGGLIRRQGVVDGEAVIAYVCTCEVGSVDDTIELIEENGGHVVVPKRTVPNVGYHVYAKDTEGNIFGCMETDLEAGS